MGQTRQEATENRSQEEPMLVLTQREGEVLEVGDSVRIHIKRIKGNWVRLCIDAPPEISLQRIAVTPEVVDDAPAPASMGPNVQVIRLPRRR